jgi:hypothetical protein
VRASSIIVPDQIPTIQGALNARPDTVLVRAIVYPESPTIFAPVVLKGIPGALHRPVVTALNIVPTSGDGATIRIDELDPTGPLTIRNNGVRVSIVYFLSRLFGGINDVSPSATTTGITFRNCLVVGDASLKVDGDLVFDRCILEDHLTVGDGKCRLVMTHTQFQGKGKGAAVSTRGGADILSASVTDGVVRGYESGFALSAVNSVEFVNNQVSVCTGRGIQAVGNLVRVERNQVDSCGTFGIAATAADSLLVLGNTVSACEGFGMLAEIGQRGRVAQNVASGERARRDLAQRRSRDGPARGGEQHERVEWRVRVPVEVPRRRALRLHRQHRRREPGFRDPVGCTRSDARPLQRLVRELARAGPGPGAIGGGPRARSAVL